jgi:hypothetical protein
MAENDVDDSERFLSIAVNGSRQNRTLAEL